MDINIGMKSFFYILDKWFKFGSILPKIPTNN